METKFALSETAQEKLLSFFDGHDITLFSRNLRTQFIDYLDYELRTAVPLYFDGFLHLFNALPDLPDMIGDQLHELNIMKRINRQAVLKNESAKEKVIAFLKAILTPERYFY